MPAEAIPPILTLPDERLRRTAEAVTQFDDALRQDFATLNAAMRAGPGGVGIAAPQLGIGKRMLAVDCSLARHRCKHHGLLCMTNPEMLWHSDDVALGREGCLSVPDWVGMVPRARCVRVRFLDEKGQTQEIEATGFEARVIQHEMDHLDGILFVDRVISTHDLVRRMGAD